jgi:LmbE family N-acetylglucosaminyl deacetylase
MKNKNILIVAPHADDEVIGCGGFISKYRRQNNIHIVYIAKASFYQQTGLKRLLHRGINMVAFAYPDQELDLIEKHKIIDNLKKLILKHNIDTVFMPYIHDANNDHRVVAECAKISSRPYDTPVRNLLMYEVPETTMMATIPFTPNYFVKLNGFKGKENLLKHYEEMLSDDIYHPRSIEYLKYRALSHAVKSGVKPFAEAFQIIRMCES